MVPGHSKIGCVAQAEDKATSNPFSLRQRLSLWLITWAGYLLIRLVGFTLRFNVVCEPGCLTDGFSGPTSIWCFWHRCLIPAGYFFRNNQIAIMISRSFDGEYIARIVTKLGFRAVRGSSSRDAVGGLLGMRRELDAGHITAFTIDGPRGPRYVAKPGPVLLARNTGYPINCMYIAVENAWVVNSWDLMMVPKPFSRACVYFSSPLMVPAGSTREEMEGLHQQMQAALERCRQEAERHLTLKNKPGSRESVHPPQS